MNRILPSSWLLLLSFFAISVSSCAFLTTEPTSQRTVKGEEVTAEERMRREVVDYAQDLLGSEYQYAGRDPRHGFDCSGFTYYVLKKFEVTLPTSSKYQANEGKKVEVRKARPGDLIFFKRSPVGRVFHVAMVVANDRKGLQVIHSTSRGVVIDNISESSYWQPKISSARNVLSD